MGSHTFTLLLVATSFTMVHADDAVLKPVAEETQVVRLVETPELVRVNTKAAPGTALRAGAQADAQLDAMLRRAPGLIPLDAGFEDRNGLQVSTRVVAPDLRRPFGFQRVYAIPGDPEHFARGNGALFAVFPRSTYRHASEGGQPTLPPSTVFQFGDPTRDPWCGVTGVHQPEEMKVIRPNVEVIVADGAPVGMRSKSVATAATASVQAHAAEFVAPRADETSVDRGVPFAKLRFGPAKVPG
ncbi:MAG: hypothetical protein EXS10_03995 [Phycisphaerales bacterium]|nr:hypothetical protein [Phycisphaerales bacterium]